MEKRLEIKLLCKIFAIIFPLLLTANYAKAETLKWYDGASPISYAVDKNSDPVVIVSLQLFDSDMLAVTGKKPEMRKGSNATIQIIQLDKAKNSIVKSLKQQGFDIAALQNGIDPFEIKIVDGAIKIVGGNGRGTAYGILELSRQAGVSPWVWWGDVQPEPKDILLIDSDFHTLQSASVDKRGIFLNDEDWSLRPWSFKNYEPGAFGKIGSQTYRRVFELLLRLRANAIWPGMHEGTEAFFKNPDNKLMADSCAIYVGTSHCEPLLRNNVDEWNAKLRGPYNYRTNQQAVHDYWIERLQQVRNSNTNMFTIGMRGIHDSSMEGYSTSQEKFDALQQVIDDQQQLLKTYIGDPSQQMQVFVPYKEVLEMYEKGLKVPDYVTLMWCDDNYGYMTRLSNEQEQKRIGGGGVYYHLSYWGRPHDYLWLTTTQPGLIYNEMRAAYDHNVRRLWIANVHDPKVAAYDLELFLDMAWNIDGVDGAALDQHLGNWLKTQFGTEAGTLLMPIMHKYYQLCGQRRPEFMGWNQVELDKRKYDRGLSQVRNTEFSINQFGGEMDRYLNFHLSLYEAVDSIGKHMIPSRLQDAYFAAIEYPVKCAALQAQKMLEAHRARFMANGGTYADPDNRRTPIYVACAKSQNAYNQIQKLTRRYNETMAKGKWRHSMDSNPRQLPTMCAPVLPYILTDAEIQEVLSKDEKTTQAPFDADGVIACNANAYASASTGVKTVQMLGHSMNAVPLNKGQFLKYDFNTDKEGKARLTLALVPSQPNDNGDLRFAVSIDGDEPIEYTLKEPFRSEQWKENVLRGQARRTADVELSKGAHTLEIRALDNHIIFDQWMIDFNTSRPAHYLIPIGNQD